MSCTPSPTATLYGTVVSSTPSTSFSQSAVNNAQPTTVVQQSCIASGTISGSSVGCVSSTQVVQINTPGNSGQTAQVPIVVNVPITATQPTQTLFSPCPTGGDGSSPSQTSSQSSSSPLTTTVLVQSTLPPSTVVELSSTTLADGEVVQTVVTTVTTLPPTSVYVPSSIPSGTATLQNDSSHGRGASIAPIVGGVVGGLLFLIAVVGSLWYLCRRRRSFDDIFEKDDDGLASAGMAHRARDNRSPHSNAEPRPYQYGLVGRVIPPAAAGEPLRASQYSSASDSSRRSHHTSHSATPLLQNIPTASSRPSTSGSVLTVQTQVGSRGAGSNTEREPLSVASQSSNRRPRQDSRPTPVSLHNWAPNMDELAILNGTGSPVSATERRVLQIVNDGPPSPTDTVTVTPGERRTSSAAAPGVIMHTDAGRVPEGSFTQPDANPPAYSR